MTLAVHDALWEVARTRWNGRARKTVAVAGELEDQRSNPNDHVAARLAKRAIRDKGWQGDLIRLESDEQRKRVEDIRRKMSAGQDVGPRKNLGEATCIVLASDIGGLVVSEDYDARVAALSHGVDAVSVHTLLHQLQAAGVITLDQAVDCSAAIADVDRGPRLSGDELAAGGAVMGRVGLP